MTIQKLSKEFLTVIGNSMKEGEAGTVKVKTMMLIVYQVPKIVLYDQKRLYQILKLFKSIFPSKIMF